MSAGLVMEAGRAPSPPSLGLSYFPAEIPFRKKHSLDAMCQARSSALFDLSSGHQPHLSAGIASITRRVIEAIPADKCGWCPDDKSKSALDLAWHIASSECFFLNGISAGKYERPSDGGDGARPASITSPADILKWYDENHAKAVSQLTQVQGDKLTRPIDFFG